MQNGALLSRLKEVFCGTLGISPCRVDYILKEKSSESGGLFPLTDMPPPLKSVPTQKVIMNGAECSE